MLRSALKLLGGGGCDILAPMKYRRGLQRIYAVLAVGWIAAVLITQPPDRLKFWQVTPMPTLEDLEKSFTLPPEAGLGPGDSNSGSFIWNSDWKVLEPQPASRTQKALWLARVLLVPLALGYVVTFFAIPWIYRGFRQAKQI
jgi:hypothetical protein